MSTLYLVELRVPVRPLGICGIILFDQDSKDLWLKLRDDWSSVCEPEDAEVLAEYESVFRQTLDSHGPEFLMQQLLHEFANVVTISEGYAIAQLPSDPDQYCKDLLAMVQS